MLDIEVDIKDFFGIVAKAVPEKEGVVKVIPEPSISNPAAGCFNKNGQLHVVAQLLMQGKEMEVWDVDPMHHVPCNILYSASSYIPDLPHYGRTMYHSQHCIAAEFLARRRFKRGVVLRDAANDLLQIKDNEVEEFLEGFIILQALAKVRVEGER